MKAPCFAYSPAHKLQGLCHPECMNVHAMTVGLSDRLPMFGTRTYNCDHSKNNKKPNKHILMTYRDFKKLEKGNVNAALKEAP